MVTLGIVGICLAGAAFMLVFLIGVLARSQARTQLRSEGRISFGAAYFPTGAALRSPAGEILLGGTYAYQDAVLRWPIRQIDPREPIGKGTGKQETTGEFASSRKQYHQAISGVSR